MSVNPVTSKISYILGETFIIFNLHSFFLLSTIILSTLISIFFISSISRRPILDIYSSFSASRIIELALIFESASFISLAT